MELVVEDHQASIMKLSAARGGFSGRGFFRPRDQDSVVLYDQAYQGEVIRIIIVVFLVVKKDREVETLEAVSSMKTRIIRLSQYNLCKLVPNHSSCPHRQWQPF